VDARPDLPKDRLWELAKAISDSFKYHTTVGLRSGRLHHGPLRCFYEKLGGFPRQLLSCISKTQIFASERGKLGQSNRGGTRRQGAALGSTRNESGRSKLRSINSKNFLASLHTACADCMFCPYSSCAYVVLDLAKGKAGCATRAGQHLYGRGCAHTCPWFHRSYAKRILTRNILASRGLSSPAKEIAPCRGARAVILGAA